MDAQAAFIERDAQILFGAAALLDLRVERAVEQGELASALGLRGDNGEIGAPHQFLRLARFVGTARDADTA